jgi:hypothetical protein
MSLAPIVDARPREEIDGRRPGITALVFFLVGLYASSRGNYVTDAYESAEDAPRDLSTVAANALASSGLANPVAAAGDFELKLTIEHLYATNFQAHKGWVIILSGRSSSTVAGDSKGHEYATYGVATLRAELVDHRGGRAVTVWSEHVDGFSQRPPGSTDPHGERRAAVDLAVSDALATLTQRAGAALDRLGAGPSGAPMVIASGGALPPFLAIERQSRYRDFFERVYIEPATGRVVSHEVGPARDRYQSRPGDWLLSRVTAEGVMLSDEGYEAYARALAARYDLRKVDDLAHYHFFGVRGVAEGGR